MDEDDLLAAYARRTGCGDLCAGTAPTLATLQRLITHHAAAIPFENIEVLCGRVPKLDLPALRRKLLDSRRGGYCFEQNTLFMAVLRALGFAVLGLEGRVRAGVPADVETGRTHMALAVEAEGRTWLVDVGFGALAPQRPLPLEAGGHEEHRLVEAGDGELLLQARTFEGWTDAYRLMPGRPRPIDYELGNWWVATHPSALMGRCLLVARSLDDGGRMTLFNRRLTIRQPLDGAPIERELRTDAEIADQLTGGFGLRLSAEDLSVVLAKLSLFAA
ncbi:arylamine N-acetyltransferase [Pelomonas sp. KK5]|uniref:arylamine N-acetyltransferase family protein n=1 Tax=Pelomonas sp. KK5 TaxID=1855730 RepID=UPI00097BF108|nr:arylamine N-acetyltransferase [Pelomonas sp. KK5]